MIQTSAVHTVGFGLFCPSNNAATVLLHVHKCTLILFRLLADFLLNSGQISGV